MRTTTTRRAVLAAAVSLFASACGQSVGETGAGGPDPGAEPWGRTFLSVSATEAGQSRPLVEGTRIRLDFGEDRRSVGAHAGCNSMGGEGRLEGDRLVVDGLAMTEMGCDPPRHAQDEWLAGFLTGNPTWRLTGDDLVLVGGDTEIRLLDRRRADPDRPLKGTQWMVDTVVDGEAASSVPAGTEAHLRLAEDDTLTGFTGCNHMSGSATVTTGPGGDTITFADVVSTRMACDDDRNRLEAAVVAVLDGDVAYTIKADRLSLEHESGRGLGLRAQPEGAEQ